MKLSRLGAIAGLTASLCFGGGFGASAQSAAEPKPASAEAGTPSATPVIIAPAEKSKAASAKSDSKGQKSTSSRPAGSGAAHAYLMRGLLNIFSLGMDDLAQKIQNAGVSASVHNHGEWREICDEIAAKYKAGSHGPIILIGHSLGADAVMLMGEYLGTKSVPVALVVPFDGTRSLAASGNIAVVMNITQRDYAYMKRGYGFRGELSNIDVSKDESIGHISIDKTPRLHALVVNKVVAVAKRGGGSIQTASPTNAPTIPPSSHPASGSAHPTSLKHEPTPIVQAPLPQPAKADSVPAVAAAPRAPAPMGGGSSLPLEYRPLGQ